MDAHRNPPTKSKTVARRRGTGRPNAEQFWHDDMARRGGEFPPLKRLQTKAELRAMIDARRANPLCVDRRVVVSFEGQAICYWMRGGDIDWYVLTGDQDRALFGD